MVCGQQTLQRNCSGLYQFKQLLAGTQNNKSCFGSVLAHFQRTLFLSYIHVYTCAYSDVVIFVIQLSGDNTFEDVCPLLGNTNYTQHVRVATDLQLTTTNLPDVVRRIHKILP